MITIAKKFGKEDYLQLLIMLNYLLKKLSIM